MSILVITSDLVTSSAVAGEAARAGVVCQTALSLDGVEEKAAALTPRLVILDLSMPKLDPAAVVPMLRSLASPPAIVAFGPHVHEGKLAAAREAGCDAVLTRGQFHSTVNHIVREAAVKPAS